MSAAEYVFIVGLFVVIVGLPMIVLAAICDAILGPDPDLRDGGWER